MTDTLLKRIRDIQTWVKNNRDEMETLKCIIYTQRYFESIFDHFNESELVIQLADHCNKVWGNIAIENDINCNDPEIRIILREYNPLAGKNDISDEEVQKWIDEESLE